MLEAGLPNITGEFGFRVYQNAALTGQFGIGAFYTQGSWGYWASGYTEPTGGASVAPNAVLMDASRTSTIYGSSNTVQPAAITIHYVIKY